MKIWKNWSPVWNVQTCTFCHSCSCHDRHVLIPFMSPSWSTVEDMRAGGISFQAENCIIDQYISFLNGIIFSYWLFVCYGECYMRLIQLCLITEMPLFRKFPEIRKFQIKRKNFRKMKVSLDKNDWSKRGERFGEKMKMYQYSLLKNQSGSLFHTVRKCSVLYFSAVIISELMRWLKFRKCGLVQNCVISGWRFSNYILGKRPVY